MCSNDAKFSTLAFNVTMRKHMRFNIILGSKTTSIIIRSTEVQIIGIWQVDCNYNMHTTDGDCYCCRCNFPEAVNYQEHLNAFQS